MAGLTLDRRALLQGGGVAALAGLAGCVGMADPGASTPAVPLVPEVVALPVSASRTTPLTVWAPATPTAMAVFSHGYNSWPARYDRLAQRLGSMGIVTLAPLHPDSLRSPEEGRVAPQEAFMTRIADVAAASGWAGARFGSLPLLGAGHSFGSLTAMCSGGALQALTGFRDPAVRAVLAFSTPGKVAGLVGPDAFATMVAPLMLVTGTADTVPQFVSDPAEHLFPAATSAGETYALTVAGADHALVDQPDALDRVWPAVALFLAAELQGDGDALARLRQWQATGDDRFVAKGPKS